MSTSYHNLSKPQVDNKILWDIIGGTIGYPAVYVAHDLKLFQLLAEKPRTLSEISEALKLAERPAEALLSTNTALGLLNNEAGKYTLTAVAEEYLLEQSPTYFGGLLNLVANNQFVSSIQSLKEAVLSNSPQTYGGADVFKSHEEEVGRAKAFTRAMHSISMAPALVWPSLIDLSEHRRLLDIGGGSGAHAIGALRQWPRLEATVFDIEPVCEVAKEYINGYGLSGRMDTHIGDLWGSPYPDTDVHFYSQIYHDWPLEKCRLLTEKSFDSLPTDGKIIIHEVLYNDDKSGPFIAAASSVSMLVWTEGKQFSGRELNELLTQVGFVDIIVELSFSYWSVVSGRKP